MAAVGRNKQAARHSRCIMAAVGRNKQAARHSRCIMAAVRTEQAGSATFTLYHGCCEDGTSRQRDIHAVSWLLWGRNKQAARHSRCVMAAVRTEQAGSATFTLYHGCCGTEQAGSATFTLYHGCCGDGTSRQRDIHAVSWLLWDGTSRQRDIHAVSWLLWDGTSRQRDIHAVSWLLWDGTSRQRDIHAVSWLLWDGTSRQRDIHAVSWLLWGRNKQAARHSRCIMAAVRTEQAGSATFTLYHGCCEDGTSRQRDIHAVSWLL